MSSKLRFKGLDANGLARLLRQADKTARNEAFAAMRDATYEIKDISVKQAPVDTGELEAAHRVVINRNQSLKAHYAIEVGGTVNGVNVDEYAEIIHEGLGWSKLGPASLAKAATVAPLIVGPHFLWRAFDGRVKDTIQRVEEAMYRGARRHVG